jgi:hypothetical protein
METLTEYEVRITFKLLNLDTTLLETLSLEMTNQSSEG